MITVYVVMGMTEGGSIEGGDVTWPVACFIDRAHATLCLGCLTARVKEAMSRPGKPDHRTWEEHDAAGNARVNELDPNYDGKLSQWPTYRMIRAALFDHFDQWLEARGQ